MKRKLIFICSPYRGDVETNVQNARDFCRFAYEQGGIPFAPHLLFTQFVDDSKDDEREAGLCLGLETLERCDELWAFGTPTPGMVAELEKALKLGKPVRRFDTDCHEAAYDLKQQEVIADE